MIWACIQGHVDIVRLMLTYGAEVDAVEEHGLTALHYAAYAGFTECCLALLKKNAEVDRVDFK